MYFEDLKLLFYGLFLGVLISSLVYGEFNESEQLIIAIVGTAFLFHFFKNLIEWCSRKLPKKWIETLTKER